MAIKLVDQRKLTGNMQERNINQRSRYSTISMGNRNSRSSSCSIAAVIRQCIKKH